MDGWMDGWMDDVGCGMRWFADCVAIGRGNCSSLRGRRGCFRLVLVVGVGGLFSGYGVD